RFSRWMQRWLEISGAKIIIGKAGLNPEDYTKVLAPMGAVYLSTIGYGTGALLGRGIKRVVANFWAEELGLAQAIWVFEVEAIGPFLVEGDAKCRSIIVQHIAAIDRYILRLYDGLKKPYLP